MTGIARRVLGILRYIDKKNFDCYLICPLGELSAEAKRIEGVSVSNVSVVAKQDIFAAISINRIVEEIKGKDFPFSPVIVHSHGPRAGFLTRLIPSHKVRYVYTEHEYDENYRLKNKFDQFIQKELLRYQNYLKCDAVIAVSEAVKDFLRKHYLAPKKRLVVIEEAIDLHQKNPAKKPIRQTNAPVIGTVTTLTKAKGVEVLIKAIGKLRERYPLISLEVVGHGPEAKKLEDVVIQSGLLHHVTFFPNPADIEKHLTKWDIFVLPSFSESYGSVILEAMNFGVPVVATDIAGINDIIDGNEDGILVKAGDENALAKGIEEVVEMPEARLSKLKERASKKARDNSFEKRIVKFEQLFRTVADRN